MIKIKKHQIEDYISDATEIAKQDTLVSTVNIKSINGNSILGSGDLTVSGGGGSGVPYTGATSDVNLGEFGIQLGNLEFDNTPTNIPTAAGSMYYNDADGTLDLVLKGGNVTLQVGQETVIRVVNKTSTNVSLLQSNYQAVRITGAQGQRPKVDFAQATNDVLSAETIGLVTETITNNQEGFITTSGLIRGINTTGSLQGETWLDGDILYLSPTVAGSLTKVKPIAPNHLIIIGYVIYAHVNQGTIFVKVDNGYELNELHNVKINGVANNNVLAYTSSTSIWENKTVETALGYTPYNATNPSGYQTESQVQTIADAKVVQTITNGVTTTAPSQDAVFDALVLKANDASVVHLTGAETIAGVKTFSSNPKIPVNGGNSGIGALVIENGTGQIEIGSNYVYPNLIEIQTVKGVTSSIQTQINGKQDKSLAAYSVIANNTNATANGTAQVFKSIAEQTFPSGNITWTGTTNPSGTTAHTYTWNQIGNMVTIRINLSYTVAGSALTSVACVLPSDLPTPALPSSVTTNLDTLNYGSGTLSTTKASLGTPIATYTSLRLKTLGTPNVFEIVIARASGNFQYGYSVIQYFV